MKELLPFFLAIAYFAFKQYKKGQKDKPISAPNNNGKDVNNGDAPSLDDFIGSFFGEQAQKPVLEPVLEYETNETEYEEKVQEIVEDNNMPYSIEYDDAIEKEKKVDAQFEMIKNKEVKSSQNVDFDLRSAVIFDAILNPPYISR